jgi:hypothetical protein
MIHDAKVEVNEEQKNKVSTVLHQQRLNASSDDTSDKLGYNTVFMTSLNDHTAWAGNIDNVIAGLSVRAAGRLSTSCTTKARLVPAAR